VLALAVAAGWKRRSARNEKRDVPDVEVTKKKSSRTFVWRIDGEFECGENCVRQVSRVTLRLCGGNARAFSERVGSGVR
jgi:hypothetical protein